MRVSRRDQPEFDGHACGHPARCLRAQACRLTGDGLRLETTERLALVGKHLVKIVHEFVHGPGAKRFMGNAVLSGVLDVHDHLDARHLVTCLN